ncbi:MAG: aerotolerance regulator BatA [Candidatus Handelsmanbacteria bacterium RIFCSPLOWO2_12_FULL_64_10]|uniref:Aerotolerance regulator BatA n=1 Tax=Handelsmanbacteria sp. (strain RIFCSPLOWO2_12_FULL_64_10) TaxID=1817868 RepID=A0A1F6CZQ0_HANXR|nr:MAG: aerotolerance regulator BatA [Candidatus Handelsmanbacteria bacterium RIFCSPLOWO2_12_FULL_64_10]
MFRFQDPIYLLLLLVLPALVYLYARKETRKKGSLRFPDVGALKQIRPSLWLKWRHVLIALRCAGICLLILALARPQFGRRSREVLTQGIDIVLAVDVSTSMEAKDLDSYKNRLDVCKEAVAQFIQGRSNDRIGMVIFAGESFTQCPLTLDYGVLLTLLDNVRTGMVEDGTAIGMGIATAVNRLRTTPAKSKVVVLLTDGVNNKGEIDPITAAKAAAAVGVKIYTIGAGSEGTIMQKVDGMFGPRYVPVQVEIDEKVLQEIARITGGRYYRATDSRKMEDVYNEISRLEKTDIKTKEYEEYSELFGYFLGPSLALVALEVALANTRFRRIP